MTPERTRLMAAAQAHRDTLAELDAAAAAYLKAETLAYSQAHPRRKVVLCAAMGRTCLHVQHGGMAYGDGNYQFNPLSGERVQGVPVDSPTFMADIGEIESEFNFQFALGGPLRFTAKAGAVVEDITNW